MNFADPDVLIPVIAAVAGLAGLVLLGAAIAAGRKGAAFGAVLRLLVAVLLLAGAALLALIAIGIRGYRALTHEEVAAVVTTEPIGPQRFRARFLFPDGRTQTFELAGDQLYVDAHVLKWEPIVNVLGLHTAYELARVAGRYEALEDERTRDRTVYSLAEDRPVDLFELRRRFAALSPLLDAEYGSGTFIPASSGGTFEVRVSTSGLLMRPREGVLMWPDAPVDRSQAGVD